MTDSDHSADILAITALSGRYARGLDRFRMDELLAPYSDDAIFDATPMGLETYEGKDSIREFFQHNQEVMKDQMHLFTNFVVELDGSDTAVGTNYLLQDGHVHDGSVVRSFCFNEDTYRREDDGWKIVSRRISPLMLPQLGSY